jgi:hypothetical protein
MNSPGNNFVLLLIDESAAMSAVMRDKLADGTESTKTNAERVATSVNNLLRQIAEGPVCDVTVVGYRTGPDGQTDVGCRWTGGLGDREFVSSSELLLNAREETRTKRVPQADGSVLEERVPFHVWYEPVLGAKAPQIAAFRFVRELIDRRSAGGGQPLVVHVFAGSSGDGSPQKAIEELLAAAGGPLVAQCHVASSAALITTAYPSKQAFLAAPLARDLFARASELPEHLLECLRVAKVKCHPGARAVVHNAKMADLFRCLQLAKNHVLGNGAPVPPPIAQATVTPPAPAGGATPDLVPPENASAGDVSSEASAGSGDLGSPRESLVVLILDRSVDDPYAGNNDNPCMRLQEAANELLKQVSTKNLAVLPIDVGIISYGQGSDGQTEVRAAFEGPLAGRSLVQNSELPDGAIRVEEEETQISNGAGGLITIKKKTPIYFDVEPSTAAAPQAAFDAAASMLREWCDRHPHGAAPFVLHLTRGSHTPADIDAAAAILGEVGTSNGQALLHTLVATEAPHKSLAYPDTDAEITEEGLRALWQAASVLPDWDKLQAAKRPYLTAASRGVVINGKFDVLGEEIANAVSGDVVANA